MFEQNCESKTAKKKPATRTKVDFFLKSQLVGLAQKLRKKQFFEKNLDLN